MVQLLFRSAINFNFVTFCEGNFRTRLLQDRESCIKPTLILSVYTLTLCYVSILELKWGLCVWL